MRLRLRKFLVILALAAAHALATAPTFRGRNVPVMAPGSSSPEGAQHNGGTQNRVLSGDGTVRLPGVNHKPIVAAGGSAKTNGGNGTTVFGRRCRQLTLLGSGRRGHSTLQAACRDDDEGTRANDGGRLVFRERGKYDETCRPCGIEALRPDGLVMMRCACTAAPGREATFTELSLDSYDGGPGIEVVDGRLVCGSQQGTKSPRFSTASGVINKS